MSRLSDKISVLAPCVSIFMLFAMNVAAADLTLTVSNVRNDKGKVRIALFDKDKGWPEGEPKLAAAILPAYIGDVSVTFHGLHSGRYAAAAFHDEDGNEQLNKNFLGVPSESYGFSNAAKAFNAASFDLPDAGRRLSIQLID